MRRLTAILILVLVASCTSYPIKDGGDGVYYASSPPEYTYIDGYFGFPYYGPYSWAWYHPTWYSPMVGHHYRWYRPYYYWGYPYGMSSNRVAHNNRFDHDPSRARMPGNSSPKMRPVKPVDLREMVIEPGSSRSSFKHHAYRSPDMKSRSAKKSNKSAYRAPRLSSPGYSEPAPSIRSSAPSRSPPPPRTAEREY